MKIVLLRADFSILLPTLERIAQALERAYPAPTEDLQPREPAGMIHQINDYARWQEEAQKWREQGLSDEEVSVMPRGR